MGTIAARTGTVVRLPAGVGEHTGGTKLPLHSTGAAAGGPVAANRGGPRPACGTEVAAG
ncbi:hypothetical protein PLANPX_0934 [Lacipirellula parvula]|uniref:Uncharacterized protein n=1 Tax=Lacipirellula parvula TaxID=2650471 RepID=A0A5K7X673_9BACT|nr:hypothetical protein PLANPX_0934 [Lacipirellula parvula]